MTVEHVHLINLKFKNFIEYYSFKFLNLKGIFRKNSCNLVEKLLEIKICAKIAKNKIFIKNENLLHSLIFFKDKFDRKIR